MECVTFALIQKTGQMVGSGGFEADILRSFKHNGYWKERITFSRFVPVFTKKWAA